MAKVKLKEVMCYYIENLIQDLAMHTPAGVWEAYDCEQYYTALRLKFINDMDFDDINNAFSCIDSDTLTLLIDWFYCTLVDTDNLGFSDYDYETYLKIISHDEETYSKFGSERNENFNKFYR